MNSKILELGITHINNSYSSIQVNCSDKTINYHNLNIPDKFIMNNPF